MNKFNFFSSACLACASMAFAQGSFPKECLDELLDLPNTKANFALQEFIKDLPTTVVKVKAQAKAPLQFLLGPGPDDKKTDLGISVGCAKAFPEDVGQIKSILIMAGLDMARGIAATKLGVSKEEIPSNVSQLKGFAVGMGKSKAGQALGVDPSQIPADLKGLESFVSNEVRNQASVKLGVDKSEIPKEKSQLAPFIEKAAKRKIANDLKIKSSEIDYSPQGLRSLASQNPNIAPAVDMLNISSYLGVLSMVSALDVLGSESGGDSGAAVASGGSYEAPAAGAAASRSAAPRSAAPVPAPQKEYTTFHIDWDDI